MLISKVLSSMSDEHGDKDMRRDMMPKSPELKTTGGPRVPWTLARWRVRSSSMCGVKKATLSKVTGSISSCM